MRSPLLYRVAALGLVGLLSVPGLTGCSRQNTPVVEMDGGSEEDTSTLTPLARGKVRREILEVVRKWQAAWIASDIETLKTYSAADLVGKFTAAWAPYEEKNQRITHVHKIEYLDVIDLAKDGHQALVTYRYDDDSYVVDGSGKKIGTLEPFADKEMQITLDRQEDGTYKVVRIIAAEDAYR